ncbi:hypothetical protein RQP46_003169 [Phenoliferia psychrophenolica]
MLLNLLPAVLLFAPLACALNVITPNAQTVWNQDGGGGNYIEWALLPATNPAPATNFFDIYIRNGNPALYPNGAVLNAKIASGLDMSLLAVSFPLSPGQLVAGSGYQLFFTDPANPLTVYADSVAFSLAPPAGSTTAAPVVVNTKSLTVTSVATSDKKQLPSTIPTATSAYKVTASVAVTSTTDTGVHAATNVGGPAEQGLNMGFSSGGSAGAAVGKMVVAAVGAGAGLWLLL